MGALLIPVIAVVVVVAIVWVAGRRWAVGRQRVSHELSATATPTIDYQAPEGQDPVVLTTALSAEGFTATTDPANPQLVHVSCPAGPDRDRAHVRSVIASVRTTAIDAGVPFDVGDVRFTDKDGPR